MIRKITFVAVLILFYTGSFPAQPLKPTGLTAKGYEKHIELKWNRNTENNLLGYRIYKKNDTGYVQIAIVGTNSLPIYIDFVGSPGVTASYKISAYDINNDESPLSDSVSASTHFMTDEEFLDMVQEATFRYFWDYGHPVSGLARDRLGGGETVTSGGSGFGVMAILVGIHRGFITREQGISRMLKILNFLTNKADHFHGAFSHWLNGTTGNVIPFSQKDDGGDLVETAFMIQGLLTARQFFEQDNSDEEQIRNLITGIWESVEWDWYKKFENNTFLYWHWSPNYKWEKNHALKGYNEIMITYLLAIASPTHDVSPALFYTGWGGSSNFLNGKSFYGIKLYLGGDLGGPLFFTHYSFLGFDPRNLKHDYFGNSVNYYKQNINQTLINRAYCIDNPKNFEGYSDSTWGLTASDDSSGYKAHSPTNDNGTLTPTAAISSMPWTPEESIQALKGLYRKYGRYIWGIYGFKDAFNPSENWFAQSYLAIDQGPIIIMIENYRSELLWDNFMANPEIQPMLNATGFKEDATGIENLETELPKTFALYQNYPNPFNPSTKIKYTIPAVETGHAPSLHVELKVYDILGRAIATLVDTKQPPGNYEIEFDGSNLSSGIYFYQLTTDNLPAGRQDFQQTRKMILMR